MEDERWRMKDGGWNMDKACKLKERQKEKQDTKDFQTTVMGGKIYSLRMAKGMTQEQLAAMLCVSAAAVSKWERGLANPGIEMLWAMADYFGCAIDEIVGRSERQVGWMDGCDEEKVRLAETTEDLLRCCETARSQGFLALDKIADELDAREAGRKSFLAFAIRFYLKSFYQQLPNEMIFELLQNYAATLPKEGQTEGRMVVDLLQRIVSGECPEMVHIVAASYVGMGYQEKMDPYWRMTREEILSEILEKYRDKPQYSEATGLLNGFCGVGDFEIQVILRNLDMETLVRAMCGAPGEVVGRFLQNLAKRLIIVVSEEMERFAGTEEEIVQAQQRVLEVGAFALDDKGG